MRPKIGIVAGSGNLPKRLIEACRNARVEYFVLALEGAADPDIADPDPTGVAPPHGWCRLGAGGKALRLLREAGADTLVFAGGVKRPSLGDLRPDWRATRFFAKVGYRMLGDDGLLKAVVREVEAEGFSVIGAQQLLDLVVGEGPLGAITPDETSLSDIAAGIAAARDLGARDIGQAVVVRRGMVLDVEAADGTDALLRRCAAACHQGVSGVLVKMEKPGQERRTDLPTIGPNTVAEAAAAGLRGIAIEAGVTLVLDRAEVIRRADEAGLFVVGIRAP